MNSEIYEYFKKMEKIVNPILLPPLVLAYIGDSVFEIYIKFSILKKNISNVNELHKTVINYVCAKSQSNFMLKILPKLTSEETNIYKRGRNTKSKTPSNVKMIDYKIATGFEALVGYLFLNQKFERLFEILNIIKT
ncbi:MAG: Mini-ribonuclease 3 [Clostridiales bacterium]|nr:Mini-ribonuclease 3 [Clostridiales bacterium]